MTSRVPCTARSTMPCGPCRTPPGAAVPKWSCTDGKITIVHRAELPRVRSISSSRAWQRTWMATPSGIRSSSMMRRMKSKSGCDAAGNPTSISAKPTLQQQIEHRAAFRPRSSGSMSAWLPSLQIDAAPARCGFDDLRWPLTVRKLDRFESSVFLIRHLLAARPGCCLLAHGSLASRRFYPLMSQMACAIDRSREGLYALKVLVVGLGGQSKPF